ncbi:MAG: aminotransferase class I/II-fold pyridoxal phosphate-dependent enzyme [Acidobacteria bacterium]|nr:MAG: aminotransferase class I/II-fold pyridoxal phosphate-dependent enzyme [Acidobacteriota bacterium]
MQASQPGSQLTSLAERLKGSAILGIAAEIRELMAQGEPILNLTVGDFHPAQFRIPRGLEDNIVEALRAGEANYPPPIGMEVLRRAICGLYKPRGGREVTLDNVVIAAGARPVIYAAYAALVEAGDRVVFGVPGWNNEYYCDMVGAEQIRVACPKEAGFLPTAKALQPHLRGARLLALNSPLNPAGSSLSAEELAAICDAVLEENTRRPAGERPLYMLYDQVYWMLTTPGTVHSDPVLLRPAIAPYLVTIDAISKCFAATGLRVGWAIAPPAIAKAINKINGHVGAWAPRPEQIATAKFLNDAAAVDAYIAGMRREAAARLEVVHKGMQALRAKGLPVDSLKPQGAIYASVRFALHGLRTPQGQRLQTDDDIRRYLLQAAHVGMVPFAAFGAAEGEGWFRISIGVASMADLEQLMPRLETAVAAVAAPQPAAVR